MNGYEKLILHGRLSNNVTATFTYATRSHVPDFMVTYNASGAVTGTYRYVVDHLGSVRMVVDTTTGAIAQQINYDEFGKATLAPGSTWATQPFAYAGGIYDNETGLTRFGARDYDASTGRWTAKDPILWGGGQTNLYQYVGGDPVNLIDPTGTFVPVLLGGAAGGAVVGGLVGGVLGGVKAAAAGGDFSAVASSALTGAGIGALTGAVVGLQVVTPTALAAAVLGESAIGAGAQFLYGFGIAVANPKLPGLWATAATTLFKDIMHPQEASGRSYEGESPICE